MRDILLPANAANVGTATVLVNGVPAPFTVADSHKIKLNTPLVGGEDVQVTTSTSPVATGAGTPDYDSGWFAVTTGADVVLPHNLGAAPTVVTLSAKDTATGVVRSVGIHDAGWGGQNPYSVEQDNTNITIVLNSTLGRLMTRYSSASGGFIYLNTGVEYRVRAWR